MKKSKGEVQMITQKIKRAVTRNDRSLLKRNTVQAVLVLSIIITLTIMYYTPNKEISTKEIYISAGTTAWDLWNREVSWDEFAWDLQKLNDCDISNLKVGQILLVPKY